MKRKTVGIRVLKDQLSSYVRAIVEEGEEVLITDRGRAVARLVPLDARAPAPNGSMRIRRAVKDLSDLSWMKKPAAATLRGSDLTRALDFVRADKTLT